MIPLNVTKLHSVKEKSFGLIGKKIIYPVYFTTRWGIHTFGVLFPIDVLILDNTYKVVLTTQLPPNTIFMWNPIFKHVVELPTGEISKNNIIKGDVIQLLF
jgi:uncharacterized membrane protein (UPF0127 family)